MANPWDNDHIVQPASQGKVFTLPGDPLEVSGKQADLRNKALESQLKILAIQKAKDDAANREAAVVGVNSNVHGDAYLKSLPSGMAAEVKAITEGRMQLPARAMTDPHFQAVLQHVVNYDPQFDAINYNARNSARKDFTSGKSAQNIKALNTAIGHVGQLFDQIDGTASHGGFPGATSVNQLQNAYERSSGKPGITNYTQTAGAVASELTQVFRGSGGAEADVQRYLSELDPNASKDQKQGAVKNIIGLLNSRLQAIGDQYQKGMGLSSQPLNILDDHAREVLGRIAPDALGGGGPGGGSGGPGPGTPGNSGSYSTPQDIKLQSDLEHAYTSGAPIDVLNKISQDAGRGPVSKEWVAAVQSRNMGRPYVPGGTPPESGKSGLLQAAQGQGGSGEASAFTANMLNAGGLGIPQLLTGDAPFNAIRDANPGSSFAGDVVGGLTGTAGLAKGLTMAGIDATKALPAANIGFGAMFGANTNEGNRLGGAALGAGASAVGEGMGRYLLAPAARAAADTGIGQKAINGTLGMFGRRAPVVVPAPLAPAEKVVSKAIAPMQSDVIGKLDEASQMGLPYAPADADTKLRLLLGSASRKSPDVRTQAERVLGDRSLGQWDRATQAVGRDLAAPVPLQQTADSIRTAAQDAASPFYEKAYAQPAVVTPELSNLFQRPSLQNALGRAKNIISEEGGNPQTMGFSLDASGNPVLNPVPEEALRTLGEAERRASDASDALTRAKTNQLTGGPGRGGSSPMTPPVALGPNINDAQAAFDSAATALKRAQAGQLNGAGVNVNAAQSAFDEAHSALQQARSAQLNGGAGSGGGLGRTSYDPSAPSFKSIQDNHDAAQQALADARAAMSAAPSEGTLAQNPTYSWKALDYTKRGLDDVVESFRDPITKRLILDEGGRAVDKTRAQFRGALGNLNDDYRQGLDAYSSKIRGRDALFDGYGASGNSTTPDQLGQTLGATDGDHMGLLRSGYATSLTDRIGKVRMSANPYDVIAGAPAQQQKLGMVFPDAPNFLRQRDMETDMAKTAYEAYGGSPSGARIEADKQFDVGLPDLAEIGLSAATGQPPLNLGGKVAKQAGRGMFGNRMTAASKAKADAMAPILMNTDPQSAIDQIIALSKMKAARDAYNNVTGGIGGLAGGAAMNGFSQ